MIAQRILAVLAAAFLVIAMTVAMLGPPNVPLGAALYMLDRDVLDWLQSGMQAYLSAWMWRDLAMPLLVRPAWLLPATAGIVCAGMALTLSSRQRAPRGQRRRF